MWRVQWQFLPDLKQSHLLNRISIKTTAMGRVGTEHIDNNRPTRHRPKIHHNTNKNKRDRYNYPTHLFKQLIVYSNVHPGTWTWNPKNGGFGRWCFLVNLFFFSIFHVNFQGCILTVAWPKQKKKRWLNWGRCSRDYGTGGAACIG